jgi:hypothetical protein
MVRDIKPHLEYVANRNAVVQNNGATYLLMILAMAERGGLYCAFFHNFIVFCHFIRKTRVFFRLWPSLSSLIRLSSAFQSLLWTSKVPKKSNTCNKPRFSCWVCQGSARFQSALGNPTIQHCTLHWTMMLRFAYEEIESAKDRTLSKRTLRSP